MTEQRAQGAYEHSDANPRPVVLFAFVLALLLAASMALSAWLTRSATREIQDAETLDPVRDLRREPDGPELQAVPARDLARHLEWEERVLTTTGWIDPINGVVRVPVERGMELSLEEGFPVRTEEGR